MTNTTVTPDVVDHSSHDAAMAAKGEEANVISGKEQPDSQGEFTVDPSKAPTGEPAGRPDNIPEKFWDADKGEVRQDALLDAYKKLESGRGAPADGDDSDDPASGSDSDSDSDGDVSSDPVVAKAQTEFEENGTLSEETFKALEDSGLDRATVEAYIGNLEAVRELAFTAAGGEENYGNMQKWAETALTPAEIEDYQTAIEGTPRELAQAVAALATRFRAESSSEPDLINGDNAVSTVAGFRSGAEMRAAMSDARYKTDPAFRAEVADKIAAGEKAGINLFT